MSTWEPPEKYKRRAIVKYFDDRIEVWAEDFADRKMRKILVQYYGIDEGFYNYQLPADFYNWYSPISVEDNRRQVQV